LAEIAGTIQAEGARDVLTALIRKGAVELLANAVQAEVATWIDSHAGILDANGRR
jgi:hypothetical protein